MSLGLELSRVMREARRGNSQCVTFANDSAATKLSAYVARKTDPGEGEDPFELAKACSCCVRTIFHFI